MTVEREREERRNSTEQNRPLFVQSIKRQDPVCELPNVHRAREKD